MLHGDYSGLIHRVNRLWECTEEVIRLIYRLIDAVLALSDDNGWIQSDIDTYNNAIRILEDVLKPTRYFVKLRKPTCVVLLYRTP